MKYSEIASYPRARNIRTHPVIAHVEVERRLFHQIEEAIQDQTQTRILGHDVGGGDRIVIHVACTTEEVKEHLERLFD